MLIVNSSYLVSCVKAAFLVIVVVMKVGRLAVPMKASVSGERLSVVPPGG